ncbi:MAG: YraN family protein [Planctomycetota bacterium]
MDRRREMGRRSERRAEKRLKRAGLVILARNWRGGGGEIDLAALERRTLVFVEVKTRAEPGAETRRPVSMAQRRRIVAAARAFRRRYGVPHLPVRFDLVEVARDGTAMRWEKNYHRVRPDRAQEER